VQAETHLLQTSVLRYALMGSISGPLAAMTETLLTAMAALLTALLSLAGNATAEPLLALIPAKKFAVMGSIWGSMLATMATQ